MSLKNSSTISDYLEFDSTLNKAIKILKDEKDKNFKIAFLALVGINVGLRISDLLTLNLVQKDGEVYVDQILQKTGKHVRFIVPQLVCDIWEKYNRELPKLADSNLSDYFREIGDF